MRRFPKLPIPNTALFVSRHFGTGVLIATAFVHLLPTAYLSLTDPCLPPFWNEVYPPMPGFIAMTSVLVVVAIEMFFATKGAGHSHNLDLELLRNSVEMNDTNMLRHRRSGSVRRYQQLQLGGSIQNKEDVVPFSDDAGRYSDAHIASPSVAVNKPLPRIPDIEEREEEVEDDSDLDLDELDPEAGDQQPLTRSANGHLNAKTLPPLPSYNGEISSSPTQGVNMRSASTVTNKNEQRMVIQCLLLEAGILFHSVFIGMALSVSTGPAFIVLLIAISFHQTFEGLALGSRIAAISSFSPSSFKPWIMSLMYGITTPIGQAIGLAVQGLYDPASQFGLLTVGIVNAISTGLLLYAGLVQLLAEDFLTEQSYIDLHGKRRLQACAAVLAGSMLMAFVGAFA